MVEADRACLQGAALAVSDIQVRAIIAAEIFYDLCGHLNQNRRFFQNNSLAFIAALDNIGIVSSRWLADLRARRTTE
jgi:hypothetical protein